MNTHPTMPLLWALASLTAAWALTAAVWRHETLWPHPTAILLLGLVLTQFALATVWAAVSRSNLVLRVIVVLVAATASAHVGAMVTQGNLNAWLLAIAVYAITLMAGTTLARVYSFCMTIDTENRSSLSSPRGQYSILQLLSLTTAVAVLIVSAQQVEIDWQITKTASGFFGGLALLVLGTLWCSLRIQGLMRCGALVGLWVATTIWFYAFGFNPSQHFALLAMVAIQQVLLASFVAMLHMSGFRQGRVVAS